MSSLTQVSLANSILVQNFGQRGDDLTIGGFTARELTAAYGTPLYAYDAELMRHSYRVLIEAVAGFAQVYYSIKANPNPAVARIFVELGAGLEIASSTELLAARKSGCDPQNILFAGPGKGEEELAAAVEAGLGEVHVETFEEIVHLGQIARRLGRTVPVAIRINPKPAALGGAMRMGGKPAAFGFDEEIIDEVLSAVAAQPSLAVTGVHMFTGSQVLDARVLLGQWAHGLTVAANLAERIGRPLQTIDLGGGLGIPYYPGDMPLDLRHLQSGVAELTKTVKSNPFLSHARVLLEPGRYLTGGAGVYLMKVRAVKTSRGKRFVITDGGMHHHLAASGNLGQVVKRDYPILPANRLSDHERMQAMIVGPLCTPLDTLGRQTPLPIMSEGDLVAVLQSGAYGLSASPTGFLSHPRAMEVLIDNGAHRPI